MTHGNIGHLEIWGTWKYGVLENMGHLKIWGIWKYGALGNIGHLEIRLQSL